MKKLILILFLCWYKISIAQISITEVYYDTPFFEAALKNPTKKSHLGEFIELYNYTTEDISLEDWFLSDNFSTFYFPKETLLKSGEFLIVAYKNESDLNYFTKFFPTTKGQEAKIIYQNKLILNNFADQIILHSPTGKHKFKEAALPILEVEKVTWEDTEYLSNPTYPYCFKSNFDKKSETGDGSLAQYYIKSLQKSENSYHQNIIANPLEASYKPPLLNYEDVPLIKETYKNNYALLTWAYYVDKILNNSCNYSIPIVQQSNSHYVLTNSTQCFDYDTAGNMDSKGECSFTPSFHNNSAIPPLSNTELLNNRVKVYPNPTSSVVTITWDNEINELISGIRLVAMSGAYDISIPKNNSGYSFTVDLTLQPKGIYVLNITLKTGQTLSKNIIKI